VSAPERTSWRSIWHIARVDLLLIARDKSALFWSYIGPFVFITFFGFIQFGAPRSVVLYVENQDRSPLVADAVTMLLREQQVVVRPGRAPEDRFTLVVPDGATQTLADGGVPKLTLHSPEASPNYQEQALVASAYRAMLGTVLGLDAASARDFLANPAALDSTALQARVVVEPVVQLSEQSIVLAAQTTGFQRYIPAYLVMFVLMNAVAGGAVMLVEERKKGQLRRTLTSSASPASVALGKITSRVLWTCSQMALMLAAGAWIYRIDFGAQPVALSVVLAAFAICASAMGAAFGTFFRDPDKAGGFGSLIVMLMAPLGGLWWPIEVVPGWMRDVAATLPTYWGFDALNRVMALDAGLSTVWPSVALLLGLAVVCLTIASKRIVRPD
jgi:ABC-2 type transport system permease protein